MLRVRFGRAGSRSGDLVARELRQRCLLPRGFASQADSLQQMAHFNAKNNPVGNKLAPALQLGKSAFSSKTQDALSCSASEAEGTGAETLTARPGQAPTYSDAVFDSVKMHFSFPASDAPQARPGHQPPPARSGSSFGTTSDFPAEGAAKCPVKMLPAVPCLRAQQVPGGARIQQNENICFLLR